jgi:hypothetical protein
VSESIRYIDEVMAELQGRVETLQRLVQKTVLPGARYRLTRELIAANTTIEQVQELLRRSGMARRLGFVTENGDVQPVMVNPVNTADETGTEGTGVPDGRPGDPAVAGAGAAEPVLGPETEGRGNASETDVLDRDTAALGAER